MSSPATISSSTSCDPDVLVKVEGVGKIFCRDLKRSLWYGLQDSLRELRPGHPRKLGPDGRPILRRDEFWSNQNISFVLRRGECLGLIGHNGAGKTTLLKMLNGLIKPDTGSITMRGRVGALIALGAGFNPILTGRENVYVNGSVLGLSRKEIDDKFDEIVDFAEIGDFIDAPVQTYSSGMQVRLGFAVATIINPEVLLVDEVLAVGDAKFRMKCIDRISALIRNNTAVIIVSHSMTSIQRVCTRAIVMSGGRIHFDGQVALGICAYESLALSAELPLISDDTGKNQTAVRILESEIRTETGELVGRSHRVQTGQSIEVRLVLEVLRDLDLGRVRVFVESSMGEILASVTSIKNQALAVISQGRHEIVLRIPCFPFLLGAYGIGVSVHEGEHTIIIPSRKIGLVEVVSPTLKPSGHTDAGIVQIPTVWEFR